jgi:hypothetical protein
MDCEAMEYLQSNMCKCALETGVPKAQLELIEKRNGTCMISLEWFYEPGRGFYKGANLLYQTLTNNIL